MIKHFIDLKVYQRARKLYPKVIAFTADSPRNAFHLRDQVCRSANSVHSDIAEGFGRSVAEFKMYLTRSLGSCNETVSHLNDAMNANFGKQEFGVELIKEYEIVGKQLYRLREKWK